MKRTIVLRNFFSKKRALTGAPAVRRMKSYSAQSGFVYQYYFEGRRDVRGGTEFVFSISADRKTWSPAAVVLEHAAVNAWQAAHERELSSAERYAIAKMTLFQAFDERAPASMKDEARVRQADIDAIAETLDL